MHRIALTTVLGAFVGMTSLLAQTPQEGLVHELGPGVFYWQGDEIRRVQTNVGWVVFKDYVFVIDANFPWGAREILPEIRKTTDKPIRFVLNTHYHADHAYGNVVFRDAGAAIVSSIDTAEEARSKGWRDAQNQAKQRATEPLIYPSVLFSDKLVLDDTEQLLELTKVGPAHTKGDTVAYLPKAKVLFVGDLACNWIYGNNLSDVDVDYDGWINVLDRLAGWDVKTVVPAHGTPGGLEILRGQRDYLRDMLRDVRAGIKSGKSAEQLMQEINLTQYQPFGYDKQRTARQVRSMYKRLTTKRTE